MKILGKVLVVSALLVGSASAEQGDMYLGLDLDGLSGKYDVTDKITAQGIVGFYGYSGLTHITGRRLYKFKQEKNYNLYGYGSILPQ